MKRLTSKHKSIFTEYNLDLEYETFSPGKFKSDIDKLLKIALDNSPIKKVCFLS